ncbi:MAG: IclR family transcriptional regulator, partial [Chloroflexi bacterium]|nr:IclR family transcriptional regulator [Chloroflexota bacterium]
QHRVRVNNAIGNRYPLHATSAGKILLTYLSDSALERYLDRSLEPFTANTITDSDELRQNLSNIRKQEIAWIKDELDEIAGVSAPIRDSNGEVVAALNVYGPTSRFPSEGKKDELTSLVSNAAKEISARMHLLPPEKN